MGLLRRQFLLTSAAAATAVFAGCTSTSFSDSKPSSNGKGSGTPSRLLVEKRSIEVNGRAAMMFRLQQPNGTRGLFLNPGERFLVNLENRMDEATIVHWHGQTPPPDQDGVSQFGIPLLQPGEQRAYDFGARPGTYWMHSHQGFQHQKMLSAPLVVRTADDVRADAQEVTIFLEDFLFRDPAEIFTDLQGGKSEHHDAMAGMAGMAGMMPSKTMPGAQEMPGMSGMNGMSGMQMDLNDIEFDAYLANDRTLDDPEIIRVAQGGKIRLRVINGSASTNFHIDLGSLQGTIAAVDGELVKPLTGRRFGLAMAQRIDILVDLPKNVGAWPILAMREGARQQTGVILATVGANVGKLASMADTMAGPLTFDLEMQLSALTPLELRPDTTHSTLKLTGSMAPYSWGINEKGWNNRDTVKIRKGQRVLITFQNTTMMAHPMHLHGHAFQVVAFNGKAFAGAMRDTVHVPPMAKVTIAFDADSAGQWLLHCHNTYHMAAGMITEVAYV